MGRVGQEGGWQGAAASECPLRNGNIPLCSAARLVSCIDDLETCVLNNKFSICIDDVAFEQSDTVTKESPLLQYLVPFCSLCALCLLAAAAEEQVSRTRSISHLCVGVCI